MNKHSIQEIRDSLNCQNESVVESVLDRSLRLDTPQWKKVEQLLTYLTEFAPGYKITELTDAICCFADDQTKRGFVLGQTELLEELARRAA